MALATSIAPVSPPRLASSVEGSTITQAGELRSSRLESLRAIAALAVLEGHVFGLSRGYAAGTTLDSFPHRVLLGGGFGVFLFFGLTGYLLFWPFARQGFGSGAPIDLRRYAINRVLRIVPLYVCAVVVLLLVQEGGGSGAQWLRFMTLTETFSNHTIGTVDGPMWSLVVEVHFYLLLPLLAYGLVRLTRGSRVAAAAVLLGLGTVSFFLYRHAVSGAVHVRPLLEYSLPATFMFFVPGMLLALLRTKWESGRPGWLRGPFRRSDVWVLAAVLAAALQFHDYAQTYWIALAAFLVIGACVLPLQAGPLVRALDWRVLSVIGIASYSLYIWHYPIVVKLFRVHGLSHAYGVQLPIATVICVAVALVSYRVVEAPFLRLRSQWSPAGAPKQSDEPAPPGGTGSRVYGPGRALAIRLRQSIPSWLRPGLRRALDLIDPVVVQRYRRRSGAQGPIPPRRLRARIGEPDIERFLLHGHEAALAVANAAEQAGLPVRRAASVLDFGCGCGRVLLPLLELRGGLSGVAGCDVDRQAIAWLVGAARGRADCHVNEFLPPLPFAAAQFELVYSLSILTHLDEPTQDAWLAELERVLLPGGVALVSVHGEHPYEVFRRGAQSGASAQLVRRLRRHGALAAEGFVFEPYDAGRGELPGISGAYGLSFQHPDRVAERWARRFEIVDYHAGLLGGWQDVVVLRRRTRTSAPPASSAGAVATP